MTPDVYAKLTARWQEDSPPEPKAPTVSYWGGDGIGKWATYKGEAWKITAAYDADCNTVHPDEAMYLGLENPDGMSTLVYSHNVARFGTLH